MPSLIRREKGCSGELTWAVEEAAPVRGAVAKAGGQRRVRAVVAAELKCCAPLDPLPLLAPVPMPHHRAKVM